MYCFYLIKNSLACNVYAWHFIHILRYSASSVFGLTTVFTSLKLFGLFKMHSKHYLQRWRCLVNLYLLIHFILCKTYRECQLTFLREQGRPVSSRPAAQAGRTKLRVTKPGEGFSFIASTLYLQWWSYWLHGFKCHHMLIIYMICISGQDLSINLRICISSHFLDISLN